MFFNFLIALLSLFMAPKIFWHRYRGKKMPGLKDRLGLISPIPKEGRRIWLHAVSLGEMKAAAPLIELLLPCELLITTATATGFEEAKRSFPFAQIRYFPLDFSYIMRKWLRAFSPELLVFIEGDLWPNLLQEAKRAKIKTALVSGKISQKSTLRLQRVPFIAKRLLDLDLICAQNEEHRNRFASLTTRPIEISGNLKLDIPPKPAREMHFAKPAVTLSCTHAPEEKELLSCLNPHLHRFTLFLAPRHPERFAEVVHILQDLQIPFSLWSDPASSGVILVDAMGQLHHCYAMSQVAIVAGSFSSRIGGHNVLEPCLYGCPVFFGPFMHTQKEIARLVLDAGAGKQLASSELVEALLAWLEHPPREKALFLASQCAGSAKRTYQLLVK